LPGCRVAGVPRMPNDEDGDTCYFCKKGKFVTRNENIQFYQWTDKGYVFVGLTFQLATAISVVREIGVKKPTP